MWPDNNPSQSQEIKIFDLTPSPEVMVEQNLSLFSRMIRGIEQARIEGSITQQEAEAERIEAITLVSKDILKITGAAEQ